MGEEWRQVVGFPDYHISNQGRVLGKGGQILRTGQTGAGHQHVGLYTNGLRRMGLVHRMVLEAFAGPCPSGMEGCHGDGDPGNNRLENLRWGTKKENGADKVAHGRSLRGQRHPLAKLTPEAVEEIRAVRWRGSGAMLAEKYGVSRTVVSAVRHGRAWNWC